jgi:hypothetical protein
MLTVTIDGNNYKVCQFWERSPGCGEVCDQDCSKDQRQACAAQHAEDCEEEEPC